MMLNGDSLEIDENLISWSIETVTSTLISLNLEFKSPLKVSQGDQPDQIVVQAGLSEFPDQNNSKLPISVVRTKNIPP